MMDRTTQALSAMYDMCIEHPQDLKDMMIIYAIDDNTSEPFVLDDASKKVITDCLKMAGRTDLAITKHLNKD